MSETAGRPALTPAMRIAIAIVGVIVVAGIITIAALTAVGRPDAAAPLTPSPSTTADAPSAGPSPGAAPTTGSEVPPMPTPPAAATPPTDGQAPPAETPPRSTPGTALPPRDAAAPLMTAPMPAAASSKGALVNGYPTRIAGPVSGSDIASSSIATEGSVMQLSLVASSSATLDDIRAHYRELWTALGLHERPAADGTMTFAGSFESLSLSIGPSATGNRYSIFGVFHTS